MNKETRTFVWGMILLIFCGLGIAINVEKIQTHRFELWPDAIFFTFQIIGVISGGTKIIKTTD